MGDQSTVAASLIKAAEQLYTNGQSAAALEISDFLVNHRNSSAEAWIAKGNLYLKSGNREEAQKQFEKALNLTGVWHPVAVTLIRLLSESGQLKHAKELANGVMNCAIAGTLAKVRAIRFLFECGEHSVINVKLPEVLKQPIATVEELSDLIDELICLKQYSTVRELLTSIVRMPVAAARVHRSLATLALTLGNLEQAVQSARDMLSSEPSLECDNAVLEIAEALMAHGKLSLAMELLEDALREIPSANIRERLLSLKPSGICDNDRVVMVAETPKSRMLGIANALREFGFSVTLLYGEEPDFSDSEYFDSRAKFFNYEHAVYLCQQINARYYHVFSALGDKTAKRIVESRPGFVTFDPYDVVDSMISFMWQDPALDYQRFCLEHSDAVCCRDLRVGFLYRKRAYRRPETVVTVLDPVPSDTSNSKTIGIKEGDQIHVVTCGFFATSKQGGQPDWGYLDMARLYCEHGIHFHLYPHPMQQALPNYENMIADFQELQATSSFMHLHEPVSVNRLKAELGRYHAGISALGPRALPGLLRAYTREHFRYCISARTIDYLGAGLPVILGPELDFQKRIFSSFGVAVVADADFLRDPAAKLRQFLSNPRLSSQMQMVKQYLSSRSQMQRLSRIYQREPLLEQHTKSSQGALSLLL